MKKRGAIEGAGGREKERQRGETRSVGENERENKMEMRMISRYLHFK